MKIETALTRMLGIDLPIIGAPMFLVSGPELVAAVSNAGGIGSFPSLNYRNPDALRDAIRQTRTLTRKPIGVNIVLYKEHNPLWKRQMEVCLEEEVELLITSMGTPRTAVREAESTGTKIFCDVVGARQAALVERAGAHGIIAVACGAGGHAGTISPFALIPELVAHASVPVVAAGAISDGRGMAAAFALGAAGVHIGTRLLASHESLASEQYKQMVIAAKAADIVFTDRVSGVGANWIRQSLERWDAWQTGNLAGVVSPATNRSGDSDMPDLLETGSDLSSSLETMQRDGSASGPKRWKEIWSAGHGVGSIDRVVHAAELVAHLVDDYHRIKAGLP